MNTGELAVELIPQGTLTEGIRCGDAGMGGFLTQTGPETLDEEGKQKVIVEGEEYLLELLLTLNVVFIKASIVDKAGNCIFKALRRFIWI